MQPSFLFQIPLHLQIPLRYYRALSDKSKIFTYLHTNKASFNGSLRKPHMRLHFLANFDIRNAKRPQPNLDFKSRTWKFRCLHQICIFLLLFYNHNDNDRLWRHNPSSNKRENLLNIHGINGFFTICIHCEYNRKHILRIGLERIRL